MSDDDRIKELGQTLSVGIGLAQQVCAKTETLLAELNVLANQMKEAFGAELPGLRSADLHGAAGGNPGEGPGGLVHGGVGRPGSGPPGGLAGEPPAPGQEAAGGLDRGREGDGQTAGAPLPSVLRIDVDPDAIVNMTVLIVEGEGLGMLGVVVEAERKNSRTYASVRVGAGGPDLRKRATDLEARG